MMFLWSRFFSIDQAAGWSHAVNDSVTMKRGREKKTRRETKKGRERIEKDSEDAEGSQQFASFGADKLKVIFK